MKKSFLLSVMLLSSVFMFCSDTGPGSGGGGGAYSTAGGSGGGGNYPVGKGGAEAGGGADATDQEKVPDNIVDHYLSRLKPYLPRHVISDIGQYLTLRDKEDFEALLRQTNVDHNFAYRQKHRFDLALQKCQPLILRGHQIYSVAVLADGRIVSGGKDGTVRIWNATTGACERVLRGHEYTVRSVAVLSDGRIVSGGCDGTVRMWNATTGEQLQVLRGHEDAVNSVAVLADGRIVSGGSDGIVRIWNATTGACEKILGGHESWVHSVAVLADGRIVSDGYDDTVLIWNVTKGICEKILRGPNNWVRSVAVLADGRIVSGGYDNTVRVWNATTGICEKILKGHQGWVNSVAVLADDRIVSGGDDKRIRIWNATTGEQLQVLRGHKSGVVSVAVLADNRIVSGAHDKTIRIWPSREYLEKKYEQSLSMTESEGRALFAPDGEGVYEALFPQRERSVEDDKIAASTAINALNQVDTFTEMKPFLKQILEQFFKLRGNAGGWRLLGGAKESYFLQRKYFVNNGLIQQVIDALQRWKEHNRYFRRKISALGIQKDVPGWIALLEKSLAVDEILARMNGEFGGGQSSEAGGGSK